MASITVALIDGLTIGDVCHREAVLRDYTAGDLIDACDAAERVVATAEGPALVASPTRVDLELLCRQVERIGEHKGPLTMAELRKLSGRDLATLQAAVKMTDAGAAADAQRRGRLSGSQGSD